MCPKQQNNKSTKTAANKNESKRALQTNIIEKKHRKIKSLT